MHAKLKHKSLVDIYGVPSYLRFNGYVLYFYRPLMSIWECLCSLCYFHNETVNIYTHAIASVVLIASLPYIIPWSNPNIPLVKKLLHCQATVIPWIGSTIYHTFMNHSSGKRTYDNLLRVDIVCIWFAQVLGSLNPIATGFYCFDRVQITLFILTYLSFNLYYLNRALQARRALDRVTSFGFVFLMRMTTLWYRLKYAGAGAGHPEANEHLLRQDLLTFVGVLIGAFRIPERFLPGCFDLAFNSHNWMHVLAVAGASQMHRAVSLDFQWISLVEENAIQVHC